MNKKLINVIFSACLLSSMGVYAMDAKEEEMLYELTNEGRMKDLETFLQEHDEILDPKVVFLALSQEQFAKLTSREQAFIGDRAEGLKRLQEIRNKKIDEIRDSEIAQADQFLHWAVESAKKRWNLECRALGEEQGNDVITAAQLQKKMLALCQEGGAKSSQKRHRRTQSMNNQSGTPSLWKKAPERPKSAQGTLAVMLRLAKAERTENSQLKSLIPAAASALAGPVLIPDQGEFSGESSEE